MESKQDFAKINEKESQTVSQPTLTPDQSLPKPPVQQLQSSTIPGERSQREVRTRIKRPTNVKQSSSAQQMPPPSPQPTGSPATSSASKIEIAQLVCGNCHKLCTYPRGEKRVQCPSCMEVNRVLEEHEVGQVTCKDCGMLLMYQYGASAVQCFTCHEVIEIGEHNRRGLPSAQQSQRRRHLNRRR